MRVQDFCNIGIGHAFRQRLTRVPDGNVLVIQPKNIAPDGSISFGDEGPLRTYVAVSRPLWPNDVLIVNRGRFAAAVFDLPESDPWIVPSSILVLSVNMRAVLPEYVACYFNSSSGQRLFRRHCEQTTVPFMSAKNLGDLDLPIPSLDRQHSLVAFDRATARYAVLSSRKQELLRGILNRELRIKNDHHEVHEENEEYNHGKHGIARK
ncbi:MAG: restriction endonuclease subunit S [Thermoanaerobaculales bacterium]|nr:restriction endonuclease subunit S [Thermoanaerobaculales bacterium]